MSKAALGVVCNLCAAAAWGERGAGPVSGEVSDGALGVALWVVCLGDMYEMLGGQLAKRGQLMERQWQPRWREWCCRTKVHALPAAPHMLLLNPTILPSTS